MLEMMIWATIIALTGGIFNTLRRMVTLPKRYNSLSDVARDPLGALRNAAQWAIPLASMGVIPGFNLGSVFGKAGLGGVFKAGNLGKFLSMETLKTALPLISAGVSAIGTMEQQKALRAQQRLSEEEARRAQIAANQAAAQQAFIQGMPNQIGTSAANMPMDLSTLFASTTASAAQPMTSMTMDVASAAQRLGLSESDLRELIRRSGAKMS